MLRHAVVLWIALLVTPLTWGDEMTAAAEMFCEKVKVCAMAQMAEEDMTPEVRGMMEPILNNMCSNIQSRVLGEVPEGSPLYGPAISCMRSMESLTCAQIQDFASSETAECKSFREKAEAASAQG